MTIRLFSISFLLLLCLSGTYAQDDNPKSDSIELINGEILEGKIHGQLEGRLMSGKSINKVELCNNKGKNCQKFSITEINKISSTRLGGQKYKVLYFNDDASKPRLSKLIFEGDNFDFYDYNFAMANGGIYFEHIYITRTNSSKVKYFYKSTASNKKNLASLSVYFNSCNDFKTVAQQKKIHKKHSMIYFYELADKCEK